MRTDILLVTPQNDEESLQILKIAQALGLPYLVSAQPHGARLHLEPDLVQTISESHHERVAIVENPSVEGERQLADAGKEVIIIDHHRYEEFNRMQIKSSLEQFLEVFEVTEVDLVDSGFDPVMVVAVAALDRGFVWELRKLGYSKTEYERAIDYYRALSLELDQQGSAEEDEAARRAYASRRQEGEFLIIEQEEDTPDIRSSLSFLIARDYPNDPPQAIIRQGKARIYLQDSAHAPKLHARFGGFTFGQDLCWGFVAEGDEIIPTVAQVMEATRV